MSVARLAPLLLLAGWLATLAGCEGSVDSIDPGSFNQPGSQPEGVEPILCPGPDDPSVPVLPADLDVGTTAEAGTIPGTFSVSPGGDAVYSMPLTVPPGRAGMEPRLAITYRSSGGQGLLGMGFSLEGFSAITRCPSNVAQDGEIRAVQLDAGDKLCLDGARLVEVGSAPDGAGGFAREYRTIPDQLAKVIAHYPSGWDEAQGPRRFEVLTRDGRVTGYGASATGRVIAVNGAIASWAITDRHDRRGNGVSFTYHNDKSGLATIEHYPARIAYTSHPTIAATRAVEMLYEGVPSQTYYAAGTELRRSKQLAKIRMLVSGPEGDDEVRRYELAYDVNHATERSVLASVKECAGQACKPPTRFGWSRHTNTHAFHATPLQAPPQPSVSGHDPIGNRALWMLADVNGDGLDDLVVSDMTPFAMPSGEDSWKNRWRAAPNDGSSSAFTSWHNEIAFAAGAYPQIVPAADPSYTPWAGVPFDYDMDGRKDFLLEPSGVVPTWQVLRSTAGGGFEKIDTGIARHDAVYVAPNAGLLRWIYGALLADVNDDGAADLIECYNPSYEGPSGALYGLQELSTWRVHLWTPAPGFDVAGTEIPLLEGWPCEFANLVDRTVIKVVDLDGDGKVELVVPEKSAILPDGLSQEGDQGKDCAGACTYFALTYHEDTTWTQVDTKLPVVEGQYTGVVTFPDVNGDGLPDAVEPGFADGRPRTFINTGNGFTGGTPSLTGPLPASGNYEDYFARFAQPIDWNGDGNMDLLLPMYEQCAAPDPLVPCWVVLQSKGDGTFDIVKTDISVLVNPAAQDQGYARSFRARPLQVADVDGDGRHDLVVQDLYQFSIYKAPGPQDVLVSITDGMSALDPGQPGFVPTVKVEYTSLIDRAITHGFAAGSVEREGVDYDSSRFDPANPLDCHHPRACFAGPRRVVRKYQQNDGQNQPRTFLTKYRDGRYDLRGRGWLGFGERRTHDADTGAGVDEIYDTTTYDTDFHTYPFAGQVVRKWSWTPALPGQPNATQIELAYEDTGLAQVTSVPGKTYLTLPVSHEARREEGVFPVPGKTLFQYVRETADVPATTVSHTWRKVTLDAFGDLAIDAYGNVLAEESGAEGVDLITSTTRTYANDPATWLVGVLETESMCSSAIGTKQCRGTSIVTNAFGETESVSRGDPGDAETHLEVHLSRDVFGNVRTTAASDAFGHLRRTCTSYEVEGIFPFASRNAMGHLTFAKFDRGLGVITSAIDPNGQITLWRHDGFGRQVQESDVFTGINSFTTIARVHDLDPQGAWHLRMTSKTDGRGEGITEIDSLGRAVHTWTRGPSVGACDGWTCDADPTFEQETTYDHLGRVAKASLPWLSGTSDAAKRWHVYAYDAAGRLVKHTSPWGSATTIAYDANNSTGIDSAGTAYATIDALGRAVSVTDRMGNVTTYAYGPFSTLWQVTRQGNGQGPPDVETTITERDAYGRVRTEHDPDRGLTYTDYDGFGDVVALVDAIPRKHEFFYDALGRLTKKIDPDGITSWEYDTAPRGVGKIAKVTSPAGHVKQFTYDVRSRPESVALTIAGETFTAALGYDNKSRLETIVYPDAAGLDGLTVRREYDARGHLLAVRDDATHAPFWELQLVDGAGRTTDETFGNGTLTHTDYFADKGTVKRIHTTKGPVELQDLRYAYDDRLNVSSRVDALQVGAHFEHFAYDALDRLTCTTFADGIGGPPQHSPPNHDPKEGPPASRDGVCDTLITYLPNGNIASKTGVGGYKYDAAQPHAVRGAGADTYEYDVVGNQIERPGAKIDYTAFDLPSVVKVKDQGPITFDYDGDQQRIRKTTPERETVYLEGLYERITEAGAGVTHRFTIDVGSATVQLTQIAGDKPETTYLHKDLLGSPDVLTTHAGALIERRSYDAFGARRSPQWGSQAPAGALSSDPTITFTGHEADDELGLVNMKGRIYDPKLARFLQTDPLVSRPLFSQSWNAYSYVLNNPLRYTDPSGFDPAPGPGAQPAGMEGAPANGTVDADTKGQKAILPYDQVNGARAPRLYAPAAAPTDEAAGNVPPQGDANLAQLTREHELMSSGLRYDHQDGAMAAHFGVWTLRYAETGLGPTPAMVAALMQTARGAMLNKTQEPMTVNLGVSAERPLSYVPPPVRAGAIQVPALEGAIQVLPPPVEMAASPKPPGLAPGREHVRVFDTLNEARDEALRLSGLGDDAVDHVGKMRPCEGRVNGRMSPDGNRGWRVDWDPNKGFHVNWWDKTGDPGHRAGWIFGANTIPSKTYGDFLDFVQHALPDK